jgi:hypothetical protein
VVQRNESPRPLISVFWTAYSIYFITIIIIIIIISGCNIFQFVKEKSRFTVILQTMDYVQLTSGVTHT